jgi:hypothetical protein
LSKYKHFHLTAKPSGIPLVVLAIHAVGLAPETRCEKRVS